MQVCEFAKVVGKVEGQYSLRRHEIYAHKPPFLPHADNNIFYPRYQRVVAKIIIQVVCRGI